MPLVTDIFPGPTLDSTKWTEVNEGGALPSDIGTPSNGVYPLNILDPGDGTFIDSDGKIFTPGNNTFDMKIFYDNVFTDPSENVISFLGWRSHQLDLSGNPAYGVDIMLCVKPGPLYQYQRRTFNLGGIVRSTVVDDPTFGANSGFRITRAGNDYTLYRYDIGGASWIQVSVETLPYSGAGFVIFGQFAESPGLFSFPWISQT